MPMAELIFKKNKKRNEPIKKLTITTIQGNKSINSSPLKKSSDSVLMDFGRVWKNGNNVKNRSPLYF